MSWLFGILFGGGGLVIVGLIILAIVTWKAFFRAALAAIALAVVVTIALGLVGYGISMERAACNARELEVLLKAERERNKLLEARIAALNEALTADQTRAAAAEEEMRKAKERADALEKQITDGACFSAPDTDRVRQLWNAPAGKAGARGRDPAGAGRPKAVPKSQPRRAPAARRDDQKAAIQPDRRP